MAENLIDYGRSRIKAAGFVGPVSVEDLPATEVAVAAYSAGGITAGNLQAVLNALADRIDALENAN